MTSTYSYEIDATGCLAPGNPSRADDGQAAESGEAKSLDAAIAAIGYCRSGVVTDDNGAIVATVRYGGGRRRVLDAHGDEMHSFSDDE